MTADCDRLVREAGGPAPAAAGDLPRLLRPGFAGGPVSLPDHLARYARLPAAGPALADRLLAEVSASGLTGRGGAAFPAARKLAAVAAASGRPVVIANATEGEPASAKDKTLVAAQPHLVLDGAVVAAAITGARQVIVVSHPAVTGILHAAVADRRALGLDPVRLLVQDAADGFVAGEATAVVNWVARGRPVPTGTPPRLAEAGLHGRPTLVQNAETLAHLALIVRYGASWFRALGTAGEPGSALVTVVGAVRKPGVTEVGIGCRVADVLGQRGGPAEPLSAVLLGGYFGTWVRWPLAGDLPFSAAGLAAVHAAPGAGLVAALPARACGLAETARVARYLADASAGQCGPCLFGLGAIAAELGDLAAGRPASLTRLRRWLGQVDGRGACSHPGGAARLIGSALDVFAAEADLHAGDGCSGSYPEVILPTGTGWRR